jgi:hypothetical protein
MCFVRISEQTATFALQNIKRLIFIIEVESVYSAVRTESLLRFAFKGLNLQTSSKFAYCQLFKTKNPASFTHSVFMGSIRLSQ